MKKIIELVSYGLFGLILSFMGAFMFIDNLSRDLNKVNQISGKIEFAKIVDEESEYLSIKLKSSDKLFRTYNPKKSYSDLQKKLPIGTPVTLYYDNTTKIKPTNNIYQIESKEEIILNLNEYKSNHLILAIISLIFGLYCLYACFRIITDDSWVEEEPGLLVYLISLFN